MLSQLLMRLLLVSLACSIYNGVDTHIIVVGNFIAGLR